MCSQSIQFNSYLVWLQSAYFYSMFSFFIKKSGMNHLLLSINNCILIFYSSSKYYLIYFYRVTIAYLFFYSRFMYYLISKVYGAKTLKPSTPNVNPGQMILSITSPVQSSQGTSNLVSTSSTSSLGNV